MRRLLAVLAIVLAPACKADKDNTKIVVAVWSDLAVPAELDAIRIDASGSEASSRTFPLTAAADPSKALVLLELVPLAAKDATITVKATGMRNLSDLVSQTARVSFVAGKALLLKMFLGRDCQGKTCGPDFTCAQGVCDQPIAAPTLPTYDPSNLRPPDAGVRVDGSVAIDTGPTVDSSRGEPIAPDLRAVDSSVFEVGAEAIVDVPITPPGTGGAGGSASLDGPRGSGGAGGGAGAGGAPGTGGGPGIDARTIDAITPETVDAPLGGAGGARLDAGTGGAPGTGGGSGAGGAGGSGGTGGATGGATGTGGGTGMGVCVFGTSRFGNCKFGP
jgi:hypothetical protein